MGTEGRNGGVREIAPSPTIYEMIVFRASDIVELKINNASPMVDPAIVSSTSSPPESNARSNNIGNRTEYNAAISKTTATPPTTHYKLENASTASTIPTMAKINNTMKPTITSSTLNPVTTPSANNMSILPSQIGSRGKPIEKITTPSPLPVGDLGQKSLGASTSSITIIDPAPSSKASELKPARTYEPAIQKTKEGANRPCSFSMVTQHTSPGTHSKSFSITTSSKSSQVVSSETSKTTEDKRFHQQRERKTGFHKDFDMDRANRRFEDIIAKDGLAGPQVQSTCYDSSVSFFDSLTSTATSASSIGMEALEKSTTRKEFHLNVETFGQVVYNTKPSYYKKPYNKGYNRGGTRNYAEKEGNRGGDHQRQFQLHSSSST